MAPWTAGYMMKNVNRTTAGMIISRYVGATGKKMLFSMLERGPPGLGGSRLRRRLGRECGRGHACLLGAVLAKCGLARLHAEVRTARRLNALSIAEVNPPTLPVSIISWM